jgi:hypothetical protein
MDWWTPTSLPRVRGSRERRDGFGISSLTPHRAFANMGEARSADSWIDRMDGVA